MKFVKVGYIAGAFGLDGALKVRLTTSSPEIFEEMKFMLLAADSGPVRSLTVKEAKRRGDGFLICSEEVRSVDEASGLKGLNVVVSEDQLPPPGDDEVYWFDIKDSAVKIPSGETIGALADYIEAGSGDVFRVKLENGKFALISNNKDHVLKIDPDNGEIIVNPEGLVDEDL